MKGLTINCSWLLATALDDKELRAAHGTLLELNQHRGLKIVRQIKWVLKWSFWRVLSSPLAPCEGSASRADFNKDSQPTSSITKGSKVKWLKVPALGEGMRSQEQDSATCRGKSGHSLLMETFQREPLGYPEEGSDGHCLQSPCKLRLAGFSEYVFSECISVSVGEKSSSISITKHLHQWTGPAFMEDTFSRSWGPL